jgi:hypothetical protein
VQARPFSGTGYVEILDVGFVSEDAMISGTIE